MSGSVAAYYSVMKTQKMGGQLNDTLVERTNVDWCFQCQCSVKKHLGTLYLDGDKDARLPRHRMPVFLQISKYQFHN